MANNEDHRSQSPLSGLVLCCTAIAPEKRTELASIALQMGAAHTLDLTSNVTHLIVGDSDTPKYKYVARERTDVKVVGPEWVEAVRLSWMEGGETDVAALETQYQLPTFTGLRICLTGFEDYLERERLIGKISSNGATYSPDLTKSVTHLLACGTKSKKYQYAQQWDVKTVTLEWLDDSLERGMILDHSLYHPLIPQEQRGRNAWIKRSASLTSLGKRSREGDGEQPVLDANRRKLRRTASAKLGSQNEGIWCDIVGNVPEPRFENGNEWEETSDLPVLERKGKEEVDSNGTKADEAGEKRNGETAQSARENNYAGLSRPNQGIFSGLRFLVNGFDERKTTILHNHLHSHGGALATSLDQLSCPVQTAGEPKAYLVVPHDFSAAQIPKFSHTGTCIVTEWWIEQCLHRKSWINPTQSVLSNPFSQFPIPAFDGMVMCSTSFSGVDLLHVAKVVTLMGAIYDEYLTSKASVLLCNSRLPSKEKLRHALEWKIPAVSADWLWDCIKRGKRVDFGNYLVTAPVLAPKPSTMPPRATKVPSKDNKARRSKSDIPGSDFREGKHMQLSRNASRQSKEVLPEKLSTVTHPNHDDACSAQAKQPVPQNDPPRFREALEEPTSEELRPEAHLSPLQSIPPEVNSPLKPTSSSSSPNKQAPPRKSPTPASEAEQYNRSDSLRCNIADLLANKQATVFNRPSANSDSKPRRRRALLGRAPSDLSNRSNSFSRASSIDPLSANTEGNNTNNLLDGSQSFIASQRVTYEDPEVLKQRERLVRKMTESAGEVSGVKRGKCRDQGTRSIGVVKDVVGDALGVAGRLRTTPRRQNNYR
ncbi:MAG: hypothetical protein M1835_002157 [Candelina submexicana]|nr:MAG: hypothetical protein M1835_002157 [Candelina submexicana]